MYKRQAQINKDLSVCCNSHAKATTHVVLPIPVSNGKAILNFSLLSTACAIVEVISLSAALCLTDGLLPCCSSRLSTLLRNGCSKFSPKSFFEIGLIFLGYAY